MHARVAWVAICLAAAALSACGQDEVGPATLEFVDISPTQPNIGDLVTVRFAARDSRNLPAPGVDITFAVEGGPGVELLVQTAKTDKTEGIAVTQIRASARVSSAVVVATSGNKTIRSPPITFAGSGIPNARQFTFQCGELSGEASGGIHGVIAYDPTRHLIAGVKLKCTAHVGDRNGDGVSEALVSFLTEAGTIGPTSESKTDVVGNASILYKTTLPLPKDVPPGKFTWSPTNDATHTGEYLAPLWMHPFDWKANPMDFASPITLDEPRRNDPIRPGIVNNRRDNLVTMIAVTTGEEAFEDRNNNGTWDDGEPFVDLTEPFVDYDDNGTWDPDERFVDEDGNGFWDGKNGKWDGSKLIWVQERILWTGLPDGLDLDPSRSIPIFALLTGGSMAIPHFGAVGGTFALTDPWFNVIAQNGTGDGCEFFAHPEIVKPSDSEGARGARLTYPSVDVIGFGVEDAHEILPDTVPEPPFAPPLSWAGGFECYYTASPVDGFRVGFLAPGPSGTVE